MAADNVDEGGDGLLLDLIRALAVALLVGLLPGWFWAACLAAPADRVMRFTYSVALSIALVPVAALAQARLFGTGVTVAIVVSSVLIVFAAGLMAYLRFGAARAKDEPLFPQSAPLGVPVLVLLLPAFALGLWAASGVVGGQWALVPMALLVPIAILVFMAGIVHIYDSNREPAHPEAAHRQAGPEPSAPWHTLRRLALPAVLLLALARGYVGPAVYDWPFIRGVDHYSHGVMAELMMSESRIEPYLIYPPGFHTMTAAISRLSGLQPLEIFPVLGPMLPLLSALALYTLARRLWGWECGVAAAFFSVLLGGTYYYYNDAMYPNLVTSQFLFVLAIGALVGVCYSPSARSGLLLAILGSSVVLYHQVASLYMALFVVLVALYFLPLLMLRDRRTGVTLLFSLTLLGVLCVLYAWDTYDLPQAVLGMLGAAPEESTTTSAVGMAIGTQLPYNLDFLVGTMVSQPVAWLGLLGVFLLLYDLLRSRLSMPQALACLTLLFWVMLLFIGSRTPMTGFPQRFGRDLGVPLAILAAPAFVAILRSLQPRRRTAAVFAVSLAVLTTVTLVGLQVVRSLENAVGPSIQLTITPEIAAAGEWLREHNDGGNIMVSPHVNQVPSRMMLAMGGYSALQSFEGYQIRVPRDLPPTGPQPLRDVLWVVNHPEGELTQQLLEKHDIRYIVLYKNMPDRVTADYWVRFKDYPGLYRTVFENGDVLIVTEREETARARP